MQTSAGFDTNFADVGPEWANRRTLTKFPRLRAAKCSRRIRLLRRAIHGGLALAVSLTAVRARWRARASPRRQVAVPIWFRCAVLILCACDSRTGALRSVPAARFAASYAAVGGPRRIGGIRARSPIAAGARYKDMGGSAGPRHCALVRVDCGKGRYWTPGVTPAREDGRCMSDEGRVLDQTCCREWYGPDETEDCVMGRCSPALHQHLEFATMWRRYSQGVRGGGGDEHLIHCSPLPKATRFCPFR